VILVLASEHDTSARELVSALPGGALSGAEDLSAPGWLHCVGGHGREFAVAGGVRVACDAIDAVVVRRPYVAPAELRWIRPADRSYVAAEATAFLRSWLASCPGRVVNRPTVTSLGGPSWRPLQWRAAALRAGIELAGAPPGGGAERRDARGRAAAGPDRRAHPWPAAAATASILVIGQTTLGSPAATDNVPCGLAAMALALAREAGTDLLEVVFERAPGGPTFVRANPWPEVTAPRAVEALRDLLTATCAPVPS
jgi:hypothetical protein